MYYFGPWDRAGHFFFTEEGCSIWKLDTSMPWNDYEIDCCIQPGCYKKNDHWYNGKQIEGSALIHHKNGWTALSFWDRSVDTRGGCNSTYFAKGTFSFDEMVALAKERFSYRWNKMKFEVKQCPT